MKPSATTSKERITNQSDAEDVGLMGINPRDLILKLENSKAKFEVLPFFVFGF